MKKRTPGKIILIVVSSILAIAVIAAGAVAVFVKANVNAIYKNALRLVDENYENIYSVFGDKLPEKEEYLARVQDVYKTVHPVLVPFRFMEKYPLMEGAVGQFTYESRKLYLVVSTGDLNPFNPVDEYSKTVLHELKHADNHEALSNTMISGIIEEIRNAFIEGESSFWQNYPSSKLFDISSNSDVSDASDGSVRIGSTNFMYGRYQFQYTMFLTLTDDDTIRSYVESPGNARIIKEKIRENYGRDADVDHFWELGETNVSFSQEQNYYEQSEIFLNGFLIRDVERVTNREEAFYMLNLYRFLKAQVIPRCYDDQTHAYSTYDHIDLRSFESALFEKVRTYGLLDALTGDETQQRFIFDSLLYMPPDENEEMSRESGEPYYDIQNIPFSLSAIRMVWNADQMTLQLVDEDCGETFAQYVAGGMNQTIQIGNTFDTPIEPIDGTQMAF